MQLETSEPVGHVWMRGKKRLLLSCRPNGAMAQAVEHVIGVALGDAAATRGQIAKVVLDAISGHTGNVVTIGLVHTR